MLHGCIVLYSIDVLTTYLDLERSSSLDVYAGSESSQISSKNILICVSKMNKGFTGLARHEGEKLMSEISFWDELSL